MHIGFTGTQEGMTPNQFRDVASLLLAYWEINENNDPPGDMWFHHGDCIGADFEAQEMAYKFGFCIEVHPPENSSKRAHCPGDRFSQPKPYLDRNRDIVDACDTLIATPKGPEELRSGTWATVRYARKLGKPIHILEP